MQNKVKKSCAKQQAPPAQPVNPETEVIKQAKTIERLKAKIKKLESWEAFLRSEIDDMADILVKRRKEIETLQLNVDLWKDISKIHQSTINTQQSTIDTAIETAEIYRKQLQKHMDDLLKDREDKLIAHGLINGRSKVLTPCDSCSHNGQCIFQKLSKGYDGFCLGPFPMDVDGYIKLAQFPLDQVNYWENKDLKN